MVKISRISIQKKNKNRYNIFIDDGKQEKYGFSVDEDLLIKYNLRKGLELSEEQLLLLEEQDNIQKVYHQVLNFLSYRMRTKLEVRQYLIKKEVSEEHIEQIIQKLLDQNLLNDEQFADLFVASRIRTSTKGPIYIKNELMNKGVSNLIADEALEQYTFEIQLEKALKIVEKRLNRTSRHSFQHQLNQAKSALQRNGFSNDVILEAIGQFEEEKDVTAEWNAIEHQGEKLLRKYRVKFSDHELKYKVKSGLYRRGFSGQLIDKFLEKATEND